MELADSDYCDTRHIIPKFDQTILEDIQELRMDPRLGTDSKVRKLPISKSPTRVLSLCPLQTSKDFYQYCNRKAKTLSSHVIRLKSDLAFTRRVWQLCKTVLLKTNLARNL